MTREKAIRDVAIALDWSIRELKKVVDRLIQDKIRADDLITQIKAMDKRYNASLPRKSHQSPYAKFDKYHKKKRK